MPRPQQNENTLGAPTEGLGQSVTFGFDAAGGTPQMTLADQGQVRAGVKGDPNLSLTLAQPPEAIPSSPILGALAKFADQQARSEAKKAADKAVVNGAYRAAQGASAAEIEAERPAWARIFGDGDATQAARLYHADAAASEVSTQAVEDMPHIATLSPDEQRAYFQEKMASRLTGDPAQDAVLKASMLRSMPNVMMAAVKAGHAYRQEQAQVAASRSFISGAEVLERLAAESAKDATTSPEQAELAARNWLASAAPPEGVDLTNWSKRTAADLSLLAAEGKFHALNAAEWKPDESTPSLVDLLSPEQQAAIRRAREAGEAKLRARYSVEYAPAISQITSDARRPPENPDKPGETISVSDLAKRVQMLNDEYALRTGSRTPLLGLDFQAGVYSTLSDAIKQGVAAQAADTAKAAKEARTQQDKDEAERRQMLEAGAHASSIMFHTYSLGFNAPQKAAAFRLGQRQADTPEKFVAFASNAAAAGTVPDLVKQENGAMLDATIIRRTNESPQASAAFEGMAQQFALLAAQPDGERITAAFYPAETVARMEKYNNLVKQHVAKDAAFIAAFGSPPPPQRPLTGKDRDEALAALKDNYRSWLPEFVGGGIDLRDDALRLIVDRIDGKEFNTYRSHTGDAKGALKRTLAGFGNSPEGIEISGGFAWETPLNAKTFRDAGDPVTGGRRKFGDDEWSAAVRREIVGGMTNRLGLSESSPVRILPLGEGRLAVMDATDPSRMIEVQSTAVLNNLLNARLERDKQVLQQKEAGKAAGRDVQDIGEWFSGRGRPPVVQRP